MDSNIFDRLQFIANTALVKLELFHLWPWEPHQAGSVLLAVPWKSLMASLPSHVTG